MNTFKKFIYFGENISNPDLRTGDSYIILGLLNDNDFDKKIVFVTKSGTIASFFYDEDDWEEDDLEKL